MDENTFEARVRELWPGMVRTARCILWDYGDAEDAAAQAVLQCYIKLPGLRREEAFAAWVMRACVNEARMILRRRRRLEVREKPPEPPAQPDEAQSLRPMLMRLPEKDRLALTLMYYENYPVDQIAATLGVPRGTAASRISRARKKLKIILEQEGFSYE